MALPDPPVNIPRIVEVQDPGTGHYVVMVRMPSEFANRFPKNPWGTSIASIGLSKQDSDRYDGYTLVDIEPMKGSSDLYWVFQKLNGPVWTKASVGQGSLVPAKYRRLVTISETRQEVTPGTSPDTVTGNVVASIVDRIDDTGKALKTTVSQTVNTSASPLVGQLTDTWGINFTQESLVVEGAAVDSGFGVKRSVVDPLGDGTAIKNTELYPTPASTGVIYTLSAIEKDETTKARVKILKSLVNAAAAEDLADAAEAADPLNYAEVQPIDKWHSILIVSKIVSAPQGYTWKETQNINLPDTLEEIGIVWDSDGDEQFGFDSCDATEIRAANLAWGVGSDASASAAVMGRPYTKMKAGFSGAAEVTVVRTFHETAPDDDLSPHLFQPVYATLTVRGGKAHQSGRATKQGKGRVTTGYARNYRGNVDLQMAIAQLGPFEHSGLTLVNQGDSPTITKMAWATSGTTPSSGIMPRVDVGVTLTGTATLDLPASSIPLAPGDTFIRNVSVSYWRLGYWVKDVYTAKVPAAIP